MKLYGLLLAVLGFVVIATSANATVTANNIVTAQTPNRGFASLGPTASCTASGTPFSCCTGSGAGCVAGTFYNVYTAGANGSKCNGLALSNNDNTQTHIVTFEVSNGTIVFPLSSTTTALPGAGATGTVNVMPTDQPLDSDGNNYLQMANGDVLKVAFASTITASTQLNITATCADF